MSTALVIAERFKFYQHNQQDGERVIGYICVLQKLEKTCSFGEFMEQALQEHVECGLKTQSIQKKLLNMVDLTLKQTQEVLIWCV